MKKIYSIFMMGLAVLAFPRHAKAIETVTPRYWSLIHSC